ncbi:hypothetical protein [Micromonospora purpureochromogenes]|uniref:Uncharacterized protein n=1 Tax=Micromonospora purpureochromogenes TaxID=47872 RepID=A0ABX2RUB4_9ACTN|nr:hypothetical protein [Micromonospora purpureochromogenes]NYF58844.1 hypothetical protein [Micromonospora purpureochromogenes]
MPEAVGDPTDRERTELIAVEPGAGSRRILTTLPDATRVPGRQW